MTPPDPDAVFISWTPQWRADRISTALGKPTVYPAPFSMKWPWPLRYLVQGLATLAYLVRRRPGAVIFTNPPALAGIPLVLAAKVLGTSVWADCHSGPWTDPRWTRFSALNRWVLARCAGSLFHNPQLMDERGHETPLPILSWTPPLLDLRPAQPSTAPGKPYVATVMGYRFDEPIDEIFATARLLPDITLKLTGKAPDDVRAKAPANVDFTGFVSVEAYTQLLANASAVLCLTTTPATMQQGIADALEVGVQGVSSDNITMQDWRDGTGTVTLVDWQSPEAIANALRAAVDPGHVYDDAGRDKLLARSRDQFQEFLAAI